MTGLQVNAWAVVVCAVLYMVMGMVWYSPLLFARPWMRLSGMSPERITSPAVPMALSAFSAIVAAFALALVVALSGADSASGGALVGFLVGFGVLGPLALPNYTYEQRPIALYLIHTMYPLFYVVLSCIILAVWR